ncbi:hypothetical protein M5E87_17345 [Flavonifractor plautii]|nr:hypothetical protein M5E87_17345 [Flavonifractor plautii]
MTRKSPYPTRADYPALIENAKPALRELLEAASYERRIAVLNECSLDVINTVCTLMVLGQYLYQRRKSPSTRRTRHLSGGRRTCGRCGSRTRQATSAISAEKRIYGNIFRGGFSSCVST